MDPAIDIPGDLQTQLKNEADAALRQGVLPKRPDPDVLKRRIMDTNQKQEQRSKKRKEEAFAEFNQRLLLHVESNPFSPWNSGDQWQITYKQDSASTRETVKAQEKAQWIRMDRVNELGGELLVAYKRGQETIPWAYLSGLNQRQVKLPTEALYVAKHDQRISVTLKFVDRTKLRQTKAVALCQNPHAKLPLFEIPSTAFVEKDSAWTYEVKVMPGSYHLKTIDKSNKLSTALGAININKDPDQIFEIPVPK